MKTFTGVIISDLHSGDHLAPVADHFQTLDQETVEPNPIQRALNSAYDTVTEEWNKPDLLVSLGDATGGQDRHSAGTSVWSTQPLDQVNNAAALLAKFQAKHIAVIRGSGYHVSVNGLPVEEVLAEKLHALPVGSGNMRSALKFMLDKFGQRLHFAHHSPSSQVEWYLTTPLAKEGIRIALQEGRLGKVHAVFRGHNHYYVKVEFWNQLLVSCPCWVFPGDFLHKKSGEPLSIIGAVRFQITDHEDSFGKRLRVQKHLFPIREANTRVVTV